MKKFLIAVGLFLATLVPASAQIADQYNYLNLTANGTTAIKTGYGTFFGVVVNTVGTTSSITIYDNTAASGTKIATLVTTTLGMYEYRAQVSNGITVVTAGGVAADVTVIYR